MLLRCLPARLLLSEQKEDLLSISVAWQELIKATITLSKCSEDSMPDWASEIETNMDVYFAALALDSGRRHAPSVSSVGQNSVAEFCRHASAQAIFTHDLQSLKSIKDSANMARDHQRAAWLSFRSAAVHIPINHALIHCIILR